MWGAKYPLLRIFSIFLKPFSDKGPDWGIRWENKKKILEMLKNAGRSVTVKNFKLRVRSVTLVCNFGRKR
jgi:hypothetical protein